MLGLTNVAERKVDSSAKGCMFSSNLDIISHTFAQSVGFLWKFHVVQVRLGYFTCHGSIRNLAPEQLSDHVMNQIKAAKLTGQAKNECLTCECLNKFLLNIATTYTMVSLSLCYGKMMWEISSHD